MKLGYTILYVASVPDTIAFYVAAFGLAPGMVADTGEYGELKTGDTTLAFAANSFVATLTGTAIEVAAPDKAAPPFELAFVTDDVDGAFDTAVAAGAVVVKRPERKPWGQQVGHLRDSNGFLIEICSPVEG